MKIKIVTPPASETLTLSKANSYLKIDSDCTSDDDFVTYLIQTAREFCEKIQNKSYLTQTLDLALDKWPYKDYIELPRPPIQSVTSIKYYDINDVEYTFSSDNYDFDDYSYVPKVVLKYNTYFPSTTLRPTNSIIVRYVAGYTSSDNVPATVIQAMYLLIGYWYENREAGALKVPKEIEFSVRALLGLDRVVNV